MNATTSPLIGKAEKITDDISSWVRLLGTSIASFIMVFGVFANTITILAYLRNRKLQTSFNHLITNLCVVDLIFSALAMPMIIPLLILKCESSSCLWFCRLVGYFYRVLSSMSIISLVFIAVNRYVGIVHSSRYSRFFSSKLIKRWIMVVWIFSPIFNFPLLFGPFDGTTNTKTYQCILNILTLKCSLKVYGRIFNFIIHLLPAVAVIMFYRKIFQKVKKCRKTVELYPSQASTPAASRVVHDSEASRMSLGKFFGARKLRKGVKPSQYNDFSTINKLPSSPAISVDFRRGVKMNYLQVPSSVSSPLTGTRNSVASSAEISLTHSPGPSRSDSKSTLFVFQSDDVAVTRSVPNLHTENLLSPQTKKRSCSASRSEESYPLKNLGHDRNFDKPSFNFERPRKRIMQEMKELKILSTIDSETNSKTMSVDYQDDAIDAKTAAENRRNDENFLRKLSIIESLHLPIQSKSNSKNAPSLEAFSNENRTMENIRKKLNHHITDKKNERILKHMHSTSCTQKGRHWHCPTSKNSKQLKMPRMNSVFPDIEPTAFFRRTTNTESRAPKKKSDFSQWIKKRENFADAVKRKCATWSTLPNDVSEQLSPIAMKFSDKLGKKHAREKSSHEPIKIVIEHVTFIDSFEDGYESEANDNCFETSCTTNFTTSNRNNEENPPNTTENLDCDNKHPKKNRSETVVIMESKGNEETKTLLSPQDETCPLQNCVDDIVVKSDSQKLELGKLARSCSSNLSQMKTTETANDFSLQEFDLVKSGLDERRYSITSSHIYRYTTDECLSRHGSFSCMSFADDCRRRNRNLSTNTNVSDTPRPVKKQSLRKKRRMSGYSNSSNYKSCVSLSANSNGSNESNQRKRRREVEKHIAYSGFLICIAFSLLILPTFIVTELNNFIGLPVNMELTVAILTWFRTVINPILYGYLNPQYRLEGKNMWISIRRKITKSNPCS